MSETSMKRVQDKGGLMSAETWLRHLTMNWKLFQFALFCGSSPTSLSGQLISKHFIVFS